MLVALAVTVAVAAAVGGGEPSEPEQLAAKATTSMARPVIRVALERMVTSDLDTVPAYRQDPVCRTGR
jgi:hypothetical protein